MSMDRVYSAARQVKDSKLGRHLYSDYSSVRYLGSGLAGGATGAAASPENRLKGSVLGAASGVGMRKATKSSLINTILSTSDAVK
jgi:hypothetical protein